MNTNNTNYEFKTNVNKSLANILEISKIEKDESNTWEAPKEYGLRNSPIIPCYYINHRINLFDLDYFEMIKDDIRNMRILNTYQMKYIRNLSDDKKMNYLKYSMNVYV
jgi:hypothetical protein